MSILIKGIEMPENCIDCFAETYNECMVTWEYVASLGRPDWCPLVEVPTPHGRLIDADALTELVETEFRNWGEDYDASQFLGDIEDAPTVIEAEGRE